MNPIKQYFKNKETEQDLLCEIAIHLNRISQTLHEQNLIIEVIMEKYVYA